MLLFIITGSSSSGLHKPNTVFRHSDNTHQKNVILLWILEMLQYLLKIKLDIDKLWIKVNKKFNKN